MEFKAIRSRLNKNRKPVWLSASSDRVEIGNGNPFSLEGPKTFRFPISPFRLSPEQPPVFRLTTKFKISILNFSLFSLLFFFFTSPLAAQALSRFKFSHPQMGTRFDLILYAENEKIAKEASHLAFAKIDSLNQLFSDYIPESELNQLSRKSGTGRPIKISQSLWDILKVSQKLSRKSKGAFDVTIGPLSHLWRSAFRKKVFPSKVELQFAKKSVSYKNLKICKSKLCIKLIEEEMQLDLGGIAKGYAADEAMKVLKKTGIQSALIDAGGDILVSAAPPGREGWHIRVAENDGEKPLSLSHCAVATSGDTYQFLEWEGKKYSHIIDPRTGYGVTHQLQITVVAPNGTLADGLASAISVLGKEKGERWIKRFKDCRVYFVDSSSP